MFPPCLEHGSPLRVAWPCPVGGSRHGVVSGGREVARAPFAAYTAALGAAAGRRPDEARRCNRWRTSGGIWAP